LIEAGHLYVDSSKAEDIQKMREKREPSPFRDRPAEESLKLWKMMKDGEPEGTQYVVRAKIDYANDNGCLRDPNVFRCVPNVPHPRMGFKYKVKMLLHCVFPPFFLSLYHHHHHHINRCILFMTSLARWLMPVKVR
jgi:glutamyl/glutaminyl-tRNA synthetase